MVTSRPSGVISGWKNVDTSTLACGDVVEDQRPSEAVGRAVGPEPCTTLPWKKSTSPAFISVCTTSMPSGTCTVMLVNETSGSASSGQRSRG